MSEIERPTEVMYAATAQIVDLVCPECDGYNLMVQTDLLFVDAGGNTTYEHRCVDCGAPAWTEKRYPRAQLVSDGGTLRVDLGSGV